MGSQVISDVRNVATGVEECHEEFARIEDSINDGQQASVKSAERAFKSLVGHLRQIGQIKQRSLANEPKAEESYIVSDGEARRKAGEIGTRLVKLFVEFQKVEPQIPAGDRQSADAAHAKFDALCRYLANIAAPQPQPQQQRQAPNAPTPPASGRGANGPQLGD